MATDAGMLYKTVYCLNKHGIKLLPNGCAGSTTNTIWKNKSSSCALSSTPIQRRTSKRIRMNGYYPFAFGSPGATESSGTGRPLENTGLQNSDLSFRVSGMQTNITWPDYSLRVKALSFKGLHVVLFIFVLCWTLCPHVSFRKLPKLAWCQHLHNSSFGGFHSFIHSFI